jgi:hypothetical protein
MIEEILTTWDIQGYLAYVRVAYKECLKRLDIDFSFVFLMSEATCKGWIEPKWRQINPKENPKLNQNPRFQHQI